MTDDLLRVARLDDGRLAVLTLDRPDKRNALSNALRDRIAHELEGLAADLDLRVVVITGAGAAFSAGFDLPELGAAVEDPLAADVLWASSDRYHHAVAAFPLPTIAAVNGSAFAGGFDLAVLCDLRVVSSAATFAHPERTFGQVVYGPLRELVGGGVARDLVLSGRRIDAREAAAIGLATRVVEPDEVLDAALALAREVAETPAELLRAQKAKILRVTGITDEQPTLDL